MSATSGVEREGGDDGVSTGALPSSHEHSSPSSLDHSASGPKEGTSTSVSGPPLSDPVALVGTGSALMEDKTAAGRDADIPPAESHKAWAQRAVKLQHKLNRAKTRLAKAHAHSKNLVKQLRECQVRGRGAAVYV